MNSANSRGSQSLGQHQAQGQIQKQEMNASMHRDNFDVESFLKILDPPDPEETVEWMVSQVSDFGEGELQEGESLKVLLVGAGQGRLEVPYVEALARSCRCPLEVQVVDYSTDSNEFLCDHLRGEEFDLVSGEDDERYNEGPWRKSIGDTQITLTIDEENFESWARKRDEVQWDAIVAFFVLSFLPDWSRGLMKILRLLKPGGAFYIIQDEGDIRFVDNTFSPIDGELEDEVKSDSSGRALFYKFWREYYEERRERGYPWNPDISPSDLSTVWNIFDRLESLSGGTKTEFIDTSDQPVSRCLDRLWSPEELLTWNEWLEVIRDGHVFDCLEQIPEQTSVDLADDLKNMLTDDEDKEGSLGDGEIDLDSQPEIKLGHNLLCYRKPDEEEEESRFQEIADYVIQRESEVTSLRSRAVRRPRVMEREGEGKIADVRAHNQRLFEIQQSLPSKGTTTFGVIHWKLEDFGDPRRGDWSQDVPTVFPSFSYPSDVSFQRIRKYFLTYAIYISRNKVQEKQQLVNRTILKEMPEKGVLELKVAEDNEEEVLINSRKDSYYSGLTIKLRNDIVKDIRIDIRKIIEQECENILDKDYLFEDKYSSEESDVKSINMDLDSSKSISMRKVLEASEEILDEEECVYKIKDVIERCDSEGIRRGVLEKVRLLQNTRREWKNTNAAELAQSLSSVYTNAMIGAAGPMWNSVSFVPARGTRQTMVPGWEEIPWESSVFGLVCYRHGGDLFGMDLQSSVDGVTDSLLRISADQFGLEDTIKQYSRLIRQEAMESAVAAIMSRNMNHLLGSHIETAAMHRTKDLRREAHRLLWEFDPEYRERVKEYCEQVDYKESTIETSGVEKIIKTPSNNWLDSYNVSSLIEEDRKNIVKKITQDDDKIGSLLREAAKIPSYFRACGLPKLNSLVEYLKEEYGSYRLRRMDLIARMSTSWTTWSMGMSFFNQVMYPFMRNGLLLHFLGHGEGIRMRDINIRVYYPKLENNGKKCKANLKLKEKECGSVKYEKILPSYSSSLHGASINIGGKSDVTRKIVMEKGYYDLMSLRGGDTGVHAFHIILENILRNSAKHNDIDEDEKVKLDVWAIRDNAVRVLKGWFYPACREESKKDFWNTMKKFEKESWFIVISSSVDHRNTQGAADRLSEEVDEYLCRPLVKVTGETDSGAWGMKEKKICAAYLAGRYSQDANDTSPNYIWAGTIEKEAGYRLAYCLRMPKANLLLQVDQNGNGRN